MNMLEKRWAQAVEDAPKLRAFIDAMVADGWTLKANRGSEPLETAGELTRDGFTASYLLRERTTDLHVWASDGIAVDIDFTQPYTMDLFTKGLRVCSECGAEDVDTVRVAFANRVCEKCAPAARTRLEKPGWAN